MHGNKIEENTGNPSSSFTTEATDEEMLLDELVTDAVLDVCFDVHRAAKLGYFFLGDNGTTFEKKIEEIQNANKKSKDTQTKTFIFCPSCDNKKSATKWASHLITCTSERRKVTGRRIADGAAFDNDDDLNESDDDLKEKEDDLREKKPKSKKNNPRKEPKSKKNNPRKDRKKKDVKGSSRSEQKKDIKGSSRSEQKKDIKDPSTSEQKKDIKDPSTSEQKKDIKDPSRSGQSGDSPRRQKDHLAAKPKQASKGEEYQGLSPELMSEMQIPSSSQGQRRSISDSDIEKEYIPNPVADPLNKEQERWKKGNVKIQAVRK